VPFLSSLFEIADIQAFSYHFHLFLSFPSCFFFMFSSLFLFQGSVELPFQHESNYIPLIVTIISMSSCILLFHDMHCRKGIGTELCPILWNDSNICFS
jgi:hypothetical protein